MTDQSLSAEIETILARHKDWMTVKEVHDALTSRTWQLRVRMILDDLVAEERAECRAQPQRQYRSLRLGGAQAKPPRRKMSIGWGPAALPA